MGHQNDYQNSWSLFLVLPAYLIMGKYQFIHNIFRILIQPWKDNNELVGTGDNKKDSSVGTITIADHLLVLILVGDSTDTKLDDNSYNE